MELKTCHIVFGLIVSFNSWIEISCKEILLESPKEIVIVTEPPMTELDLPMNYEDDVIEADLDLMKSLYTELLQTYDTRIRPRLDQSDVVEIQTLFVPKSIIEFDTTEQKYSILGYFRIFWRDELLIWNPDDYTGTNTVKIPVKDIWTPTVTLVKTFDGNGIVGDSKSDIAKISAEGNVQWVPEGIYNIVCEVDIQYYPFDEQTCVFTYYVSDETLDTISLNHDVDVTLKEFVENSAWELIEVTKQRRTESNNHYIDISFALQRRSSFTIITLLTPLLMLAFLNIAIFLVPIDSGEKGSFAVTIFLSYGIFVTIVSGTLPHNSLQVSYFVLFIIALLALSVLSVFYVVVQSKLVILFGNKECNVKFLCIRKPTNLKKSSTEVKEPEFTWGMFFEKLDTWLFGIFFIAIATSSVIFMGLMMRRIRS